MKLRKKLKARKALGNFHLVFFRKLVDLPRIRGENISKLYQSEFDLWITQVGCPLQCRVRLCGVLSVPPLSAPLLWPLL